MARPSAAFAVSSLRLALASSVSPEELRREDEAALDVACPTSLFPSGCKRQGPGSKLLR
jgi:hypothetical protein